MDQKTLDGLLARVIEQARQAGIPVSAYIDPKVRVNYRARSRFGCCVQKNGRYYIEVAEQLLGTKEEAVCQVLAHEVLHSCRGCANHGLRWKDYAARMNEQYGYEVARTDTFEKLGLADQRPIRYLVVCRSCGQTMSRMRRSALVEHPERYRCRCGGTLEVRQVGENGGETDGRV